MCHKLLQAYHCGDVQLICTTPCPHALKTGTPAQQNSLERSNTSTSNTLPARTTSVTTTHSDISTLPSQRGRIQTLSTTPTTPPPAYRPSSSAESEPERIPNLCPYFFTRKLGASAHPCFNCYMKPQYEAYRKRWLDHYRGEHPGQKFERIEELAGFNFVAEKVGLLNVVKEMERLERRED